MKTAEKSLQFGVSKCKSMIIGKDTDDFLNSELQVDNWTVEHFDNMHTGEADISEYYNGKVSIEQTFEQMYLGFVISSTGDNMANISQLKKKSIGVIRRIINKLNSLNLRKYYFECAMIFLNVMLRGSILYACEVYYNLKETELRQIERIEENLMRQILKTSKGCPITQLYLELGQIPARFVIQKLRLLYLKYILQQGEESTLKQFLKLQLEQPTKGDWASTCKNDLKSLDISESLEEIKVMTKNSFKKILNNRIEEKAFKYLIEKQGKKGKEIKYSCIQLSEYLSPINSELTVEEKRTMFAVRNYMVNIPTNFPKPNVNNKCFCGELETMLHIYNCEVYSTQEKVPYEKIFNGSLDHQIEIFQQFEVNLKERENL